MIFAVFVIAILWLNTVRLFTALTPDDKTLSSVLLKLILPLMFLQCSIQQTAFFIGCYTGKLDKVLSDIRFDSKARYAQIRRVAIGLTILTWINFLVNVGFCTYLSYFTSFSYLFLTPFGTHLKTDSGLLPMQVLSGIINVGFQSALVFPVAMARMLCVVFSLKFHEINNRLRQAIKTHVIVSDDIINDIKDQHQRICRLVESADRFLSIFFLAALLCSIAIVIGDIYIALWNTALLANNPTVITTLTALLANNPTVITTLTALLANNPTVITTLALYTCESAYQLITTSLSCTAVNHYVCISYSEIYRNSGPYMKLLK